MKERVQSGGGGKKNVEGDKFVALTMCSATDPQNGFPCLSYMFSLFI